MNVRINERNQSFDAHAETGELVSSLSWDWAREKGAAFRAELATVAVSPKGEVHEEPPGGWVDEPVNTKGQTVKRLPAELTADPDPRARWTISERWRMRAWSPISAEMVDIDGQAWCRFSRVDGRELAAVLVSQPDAELALVPV